MQSFRPLRQGMGSAFLEQVYFHVHLWQVNFLCHARKEEQILPLARCYGTPFGMLNGKIYVQCYPKVTNPFFFNGNK